MGEAGTSGEFITLARVLKTQGRRGEVAVELHSDVPNRFHEGMRLLSLGRDGVRRELLVEEFWPHQGRLVLKFAGIDSISDAAPLVGCELQVHGEERAELASGWTYVSDLVGCVVFDGELEVGTISDVRFGAGEAPLLVVRSPRNEYEIPYAEAYLKSADLEHKRIQMLLPAGMLDVNAPLTAEEKREQASQRPDKRRP
jgi:16S rRNA processing protein RimM